MRNGSVLLAGLVWLTACEAQSTRVIVELNAEASVEAATRSLRVRVQLGEVPFRDETASEVRWPRWVVVEPLASAPTEDFELWVDALDAEGRTVGSVRVHAAFVPNETRFARVVLSPGCSTVELDPRSMSPAADPPIAPTAPCRRWQAPVTLDPDDLHHVSGPVIGATGDGAAIASWHEYEVIDADTGTHAVWTARLQDGAWGSRERLAARTAPVAGSPPRTLGAPWITAAASGSAIVLWASWDGEEAGFSARRFDGEAWSTTSSVMGYSILYPPHVVQFVGSRGGTAIFCSRMDNGRGWQASTRRFDGSTWNSEALTLLQGGASPYPRPEPADCAIDDEGNAIAAWTLDVPLVPDEGLSPAQSFVGARWLDAGATDWGAQEVIESGNSATGARVSLSNDGEHGIVTWERAGLRYFSEYERGAGWTSVRELPVAYDRLVLDDDGHGLAIVAREGLLQSVRYDAESGRWSELGRIDAANGGEATRADFALEPGGRAVAAWIQPADGRPAVWAAYYVPEAGWSRAEQLDPDAGGEASTPRVAIDEFGTAFVVWQHVASGVSSVRTSRLDAP